MHNMLDVPCTDESLFRVVVGLRSQRRGRERRGYIYEDDEASEGFYVELLEAGFRPYGPNPEATGATMNLLVAALYTERLARREAERLSQGMATYTLPPPKRLATTARPAARWILAAPFTRDRPTTAQPSPGWIQAVLDNLSPPSVHPIKVTLSVPQEETPEVTLDSPSPGGS